MKLRRSTLPLTLLGLVVFCAALPRGALAEPVSNADIQAASTIRGLSPDLTVSVSDAPDPVAVGQTVDYDINVGNVGTAAASMVDVSVFYSGSLTPVPLASSGWTCISSTVISCTLDAGSLPSPGSAPLLRLRFTAPPTAQVVQVTVSASSLEPDVNPSNNTNITQNTQVVNSNADLNLAISSSATTVEVGTPISFTANVSNAGPGAAPSLQVSGTLSGAVVFSNFNVSTSWNCTHSAGAISCTYQGGAPSGTLASGLNAAPIVINGVAGPGTGSASLGLTATSTANDPTPATANAAIAVTAAAPGSVDLSLTKVVVGGQPIPRNVPFVYRLVVSNAINSTQTASGIQIADPLPAGIVLQGFSGSGWNCSGNVNCSYAPTLAAGQSSVPLDLQVVYDSAVPPGGTSVSNTATVSGADPDPDPANNQASATASIRGSSDLAVQLIGASPVVAGSSFTLDLVANNLGPDVASNVTATATIASGFGVGIVSGGAGWSCLASGQSVSCQRATMTTGSSTAASLTLNAPGSAGGPFNQQGSISSDNFDAVTSNNLASLPITVIAAVTTLNLTKTDSVDPVALGTPFDYLLTVSNAGNVSQTGLTVIDTLPADLSYLSFVGAGWNCTASTSVPVVVNCSNPGPLAAGASASVSLRVRGNAVGSVTNTAQASSQQNTLGTSASQATTITQPQSLSFSKQARNSSVALGQNAVFDITVSNSGQSEALGLVMLDDLPSGLDFQSASGTGWTCTFNAGRVDCRRPSLAAGASSTIVLETLPASAGSFVNRAQLQALGLAPLLSNASVTVTNTPPPGGADLALEISDSADPATAGTPFNYLIRVRNLGPGSASGIRVVNSPSLNLSVLSSSSPGWTCPLVGTPECTLAGPLAPGAESLLSLRVRADSVGTASNSAVVSASETDPVTANNSAQESTQIVSVDPSAADLSLALSGPASAAAGDTVDLVANVLNLGPSAAANVLLRARSSGELTIQSGSGGGFSCNPAGGGVDCRLASLAAGGSAVLNLRAVVGTTASGSVQALLDVNSGPTDPNPADNSAVAQITVTSVPPPPDSADLAISQTVSDDPLAFAQRFSYSVRVNNLGPATAQEVLITEVLPVGVTLVSAAGAGLVCSGTSTVLCQASAPLPSGQQLQLTVTVDAPNERATLNNEVSVSARTADPVLGNNRTLLGTEVLPPEGEEAGESLMGTTLGDTLAGDAVNPVVDLCDGSTGQVSALCDALFQDAADGRNAEVSSALRALYPEEVLSQHASLNQLANAQSFNLDARLSQLHNGGGAGVNLGGLNVINGTQSIPIALLQSLFQNADEPEIGGPGDLISPWGFFVNGTISRGDQNVNGSNREVVLDFDSIGLTAGVDYRRSARWVMGAAVGFDKFNSALTDDGKLETRALTLSGYSAYYLNDLTYLDTRLSYGRVNLDQTRRLRVNLTGFSLDETLTSDTQANQLTLATSVGHHFTRGAWTFTPNGFVRYMRSTVDGFSERGSDFAVRYGDQTVSSLVFGAGIQINRVISLSNGVLTPQFDLIWNHESRNDDTVIDASFVSGGPGEFFSLSPEEPDNSYGSLGIGLVYVLANGKQAYLQWRESVGVDGLSRSTVNLGARFEF
ncbi:MAG: autotransporter domain-containing protein [Lysobacterales bacterium]